MIVSPYCSRQRHTRSTNASRPISSRLVPSDFEQPLDLRLRGDAGVVGAEDPLRPLAAHAGEADQRVLDRPVERVPHVQRAGDVRRRDRDRVVLGRGARGLRVEAAGLEPAREDARLALVRVVAGAVLERHRRGESRTSTRPEFEPLGGLRGGRGRLVGRLGDERRLDAALDGLLGHDALLDVARGRAARTAPRGGSPR